MLLSTIHCCDVTKPPYLLRGKLCTSPLHSNRLYVYTVCCRRGGQCFSVLRTRYTDVVGDCGGRSYITEQGHNVPLLHTCGLYDMMREEIKLFVNCIISRVILHQKLKNMEFCRKNLIRDFLLNFVNVKVIYFES